MRFLTNGTVQGLNCRTSCNTSELWKTASNREDGHHMVTQQVQNILRHLKEAHQIEKHLVTEPLLPHPHPHFLVGIHVLFCVKL